MWQHVTVQTKKPERRVATRVYVCRTDTISGTICPGYAVGPTLTADRIFCSGTGVYFGDAGNLFLDNPLSLGVVAVLYPLLGVRFVPRLYEDGSPHLNEEEPHGLPFSPAT